MFFNKYRLGKNPSKEEIQKKIDEPIKRPFSFGGVISYGGNKEAISINKNDTYSFFCTLPIIKSP